MKSINNNKPQTSRIKLTRAHAGHLITLSGLLLLALAVQPFGCQAKDYYYTRTRRDPQHLRVSEEFKNNYVNEVSYKQQINGTEYEYFKSSSVMSHDELIFETIDKIFRHRLSPFYIHHYDNEEDRKRSSDGRLVAPDRCARDLMYLVDKLPRHTTSRRPLTTDHLTEQLTPELSAFFDSYARQEPGLLMGNTFWVGAYDQCVNRHIFELTSPYPGAPMRPPRSGDQQQAVSFKGRYCVSALKSPLWDAAIRNKKQQAKNYFKTQRQLEDYDKLFRLQVGVCLPSSCDSSAIERHAAEVKLLTSSQLDPRYADYELIDLYCLPDESSELRAWQGSSLYFLVFVSAWCTLLFLATLADVFDFVDLDTPPHKVNGKAAKRFYKFVLWFSLRANYRKLMKVSDERPASKAAKLDHKPQANNPAMSHNTEEAKPPNKGPQAADAKTSGQTSGTADKLDRPLEGDNHKSMNDFQVNLRFLNAFKAMIMFWIVNGHIMLLMIQTAKNILYSDALLNGLMHFLIGATFGVDLFFTMTGFLTSYLIFNSGQAYKMRPVTWLYLSFHRYWRLAPLYLISFWFSRSVAQRLGSGPLWDYGTSRLTFRGLCNNETWWYPLTLTSNLHGLFEECMITSWYISCDMQFWLVSPVFIWLLAKHPAHGWIASLATIAMSSKLRYDAILGTESARYDELVQPRADIFMRVSHDLPALYTHPHYRISAYIVGLLAGHFVYMVKAGRWRSSLTSGCLREGQSAADIQREAEPDSPVPKSGKATKDAKTKAPTKSRLRNTIAYLGLFLFLFMSFISYLLSHFYPTSLLRYAKMVAAFAYAVDHLAMSLGASLVIVAMCFNQWPRIIKFLSHPFWSRLSKINYALLLLQCEAIYFQIFRYDQMPVAGTRELINILFNLLVTLYPVAFGVTLAFEYPLANIEKLLI